MASQADLVVVQLFCAHQAWCHVPEPVGAPQMTPLVPLLSITLVGQTLPSSDYTARANPLVAELIYTHQAWHRVSAAVDAPRSPPQRASVIDDTAQQALYALHLSS